MVEIKHAKCRHCETEMELSDSVDLTQKVLRLFSIADKLPFKEPKPSSLQFLKCSGCGYTEMFFK
jgi:predicted nucleic-acid-binding Zn-ribbon protein